MSYSFVEHRDPSIDVYNRPLPSRQVRLEPQLKEVDEESSLDSSYTRDAVESSENCALPEGRAEVYLRLRALADGEERHNVYKSSLSGLKVVCPKSDAAGRSKTPCTQLYSFTRVFEPLNTQRDVYDSAIKNHIDNEEHAVFVTYGTSGSGKTYTLLGDKNSPGIVPRAVQQIFTKYEDKLAPQPTIKYQNGLLELLDDDKAVQEMILRRKILESPDSQSGIYDYSAMQEVIEREEGFSTEDINDHYVFIWVSFLEIYNEKVYDLLDTAPLERGMKRPELKVISNKGHPYAKNLTHIYAKSSEDVVKILNYGLNRVNYASTMINTSSSRSHTLFNVLVIKNSQKDYSCISYCFGDLAGSERLKKTENMGDRLREAQNINKSLMFLGKCLNVLHENRQRKLMNIVPFRESKLTLLIQTALMGKENLVLIVNLWPIETYYEENLRVLDFAAIAREIVHVKSPEKKVKVTRYSFLMAQASGVHELLLDENYRLKMDLRTEQDENCALREENDQLREKMRCLLDEMLDKEVMIRQNLIQDSLNQLDKQKELQNLDHQHKIAALQRTHAAEVEKLKIQIRLLQAQVDGESDSDDDSDIYISD
ncbi:kinesin-like protein subito [Phlebotomus argentipes]|uniref:kinesin-like protein subito n=1 Tax=Phlebotomus argentipes TaxID=94469 RepID=UPI0028931CDF|nr:kinesin-like protein subito [Phlebotomus argentipes]